VNNVTKEEKDEKEKNLVWRFELLKKFAVLRVS
jgi:hypothetical protein